MLTSINGVIEIRNASSLSNVVLDDSGDAVARPTALLDTVVIGPDTFGRLTGLGNGADIRYRINARDVNTEAQNWIEAHSRH